MCVGDFSCAAQLNGSRAPPRAALIPACGSSILVHVLDSLTVRPNLGRAGRRIPARLRAHQPRTVRGRHPSRSARGAGYRLWALGFLGKTPKILPVASRGGLTLVTPFPAMLASQAIRSG